MAEEKYIVGEVSINVKNSDGTGANMTFVVPKQVSDQILLDAVEWDKNWIGNFREVERFVEAKNEYVKENVFNG